MGLLPVGIEIAFLAEPAQIGWLVNWDVNNEGKVALWVEWLGLKNKKTGYWFDKLDFSPSPDQWRNYHGVVRCRKNLMGKGNFFTEINTQFVTEIESLEKLVDIFKRRIAEMLQFIEKHELVEAKKKETFHNSEAFRALRDLILTTPTQSSEKSKGTVSKLFNV